MLGLGPWAAVTSQREQPSEGPGPGGRGPRIEWGELKGWVAQAAITTYHSLGGLNDRHLFLTVLEAGSPRS